MKKLKAFTLIEIICSISLLILVSLSLMNISVHTLNTVKNNNNSLKLIQISDNLEYYLKEELNPDKISLSDYNKDDYILHYQTFYKEVYTYRLSDKKLRFFKDNNVIMLSTKNIHYKKENGQYKKLYENDFGNNIVEENIKDIKVYMLDNKLNFEITIFSENLENTLTFHIKDLKKRDFIN